MGVGVGVFVGVSVGVDVRFLNKYPAIRSLADFGRFANNYSLPFRFAVAGASASATCTTEADEEDRSATSSNCCQATRISSTTSTAVSIAQPFSVSIATEYIRQKTAMAEGTQQADTQQARGDAADNSAADTKQARGDAADNSAETKTWPQLMGPRMV